MAYYLLQVSYAPEGWAALINKPQDRQAAVRGAVEKLGGKLERSWLSFGDYDLVGLLEMPDGVSAAAFAMAVAGGGACKTVKTTPLLTIEEGMQAMQKAATCGYKPATKA